VRTIEREIGHLAKINAATFISFYIQKISFEDDE
jgi:hypothetical protein